MHIQSDTQRCIGAGNCVMAAPDVFDQREDDGTVILLQEHPDESLRGEVLQAVQLCPAAVLRIVES
jgi:ferredoxin